MQKSEIVAKIEEVKKTLADLQEQLEKGDGWWEPKFGEGFWCIYNSRGLGQYCYNGEFTDNAFLRTGNFYRTEKEAQRALDRQIALTAMRKYIAEEGIGWKGEIGGHKFYPVWRNGVDFDFCSGFFNYQPDSLYTSSEKQIEQFIKDQESNLRIYFGV